MKKLMLFFSVFLFLTSCTGEMFLGPSGDFNNNNTQESEKFKTGDGSKANPYRVSNAKQLNNVRNYPNKHFIQTKDIDLIDYRAGNGWEPIANFTGTYNGKHYKIKNLFINKSLDTSNLENIGLFGTLKDNAQLQNIILINPVVFTNQDNNKNVGSLVGYAKGEGVVIEKCGATGIIIFGNKYIGGLVGHNQGVIKQSYAIGTVNGKEAVGGLVGCNEGETASAGGMIENCYAQGHVSGNKDVGGLVGAIAGTHPYIKSSYAACGITATDNIGGLVGSMATGDVVASFYDTNISGQDDTGKGTLQTTTEMKDSNTFAGWDTSIWNFPANSYPTLKYQ